ncbi:VRR-NUC domain-containing protein [Blastocladiella britannica]|nr:VRR-NUC domain-containing protein [Blastocladiella britannica]
MYHALFSDVVSTVLDSDEAYLLGDDHAAALHAFRALPDPAQLLFCRLIQRKPGRWIRTSTLEYAEIGDDMAPAVRLLANEPRLIESLAIGHDNPNDAAAELAPDVVEEEEGSNEPGSSTPLQDFLGVLTVDELRALASHLRLPVPAASRRRRPDLLSFVTTRASRLPPSTLREAISAAIPSLANDPPLIRISATALLHRLHLVYFRSPCEPGEPPILTTPLLAVIGRRRFPRFTCTRTAGVIWPTLEDLVEYETAERWVAQLQAALDATEETRALVGSEILPRWRAIVASGLAHVTGLPWFSRFCAGYPLTKCIELHIGHLSRARDHAVVVELCTELLNQSLFRQSKRGAWYSQLALSHHVHLKNLAAAHKACINGLEDPRVTRRADVWSMQKRLAWIQVSLRVPYREQRRFEEMELRAAQSVVFPATRVGGAFVKGMVIEEKDDGDGDPSAVVSRPKYKDPETGLRLLGVEDYALACYALEPNGGWKGVHTESGIVATLFGMLLFDEMFDDGVPGVFESQYQTAPLDLVSADHFYAARKPLIDAKLDRIRNAEAAAILTDVDERERERGTVVTGVQWTYPLEDLVVIAEGIGGAALASILLTLALDYPGRRSGMPDLVLWRSHPKPETVFSEVKGPGDVLSDRQRVWIDELLAVGLQVHVCHVVVAGQKQLQQQDEELVDVLDDEEDTVPASSSSSSSKPSRQARKSSSKAKTESTNDGTHPIKMKQKKRSSTLTDFFQPEPKRAKK